MVAIASAFPKRPFEIESCEDENLKLLFDQFAEHLPPVVSDLGKIVASAVEHVQTISILGETFSDIHLARMR